MHLLNPFLNKLKGCSLGEIQIVTLEKRNKKGLRKLQGQLSLCVQKKIFIFEKMKMQTSIMESVLLTT